MKKIKSNPDKTILTICTGLIVIYFFTDFKLLILTSMALGLLGVFSKFSGQIIEKIWFKDNKNTKWRDNKPSLS